MTDTKGALSQSNCSNAWVHAIDSPRELWYQALHVSLSQRREGLRHTDLPIAEIDNTASRAVTT